MLNVSSSKPTAFTFLSHPIVLAELSENGISVCIPIFIATSIINQPSGVLFICPSHTLCPPSLAAYFSQQKLDGLATLDTVPGIGDVDIPDGWFKSARAGKSRRDHRDTSTTTTNTSASATAKSNSTPPTDLHLHHHPSPVSHHQHHQHRPHNSSSSSTTSNHHRASRYPHRTYKDETSHSPPSDHFLSPKQQSPILGALPLGNSGRLVPLQYLQAVAYPRRDPADEQLLKRFSTHSPSSCSHIRQSSHPCGL